MEKILLILSLLNNSSDEYERQKELESRIKKAEPAGREQLKICTKQNKVLDCRTLTQAEISAGAVRGIKIDVDNPQP